ncbi:PH domain-containing protein, partial [Leptospira santarosai]|nr:PH domain-containing protein [Leptospira santarosai]
WVMVICVVLPILYTYIFVYLFPKLRWLRWRYEVREQEIELQYGLFVVKRTLVPMVRVQHVDTEQGPILRRYDLASITISTAATNHTIPALITGEADELRSRISTLARVAEDDV